MCIVFHEGLCGHFFFRFGSFRLQKMATRKRSEPATAGFGVEPLGLARPCPEAKSARREGDRDSNLSGRHWEFMCSAACMQAARVARSALEFSCALLSGSHLFLRERDRFHIAGEMKTTCASPTIISIDVEEDAAAGTGIALSLNLGMGNCSPACAGTGKDTDRTCPTDSWPCRRTL